MAETPGIQSFLPWVRQGLASLPPDPLTANLAPVVKTPVEVRLQGGGTVLQQLRMYGPGDVVGIDPRHVIRTEPPNLSRNFESNFLAAIEFDRPDFPWLFTPASPDAKNRLRPWLCLIVVRQQDGVNILGGANRPLPVLEIKGSARASAELPNLAESWAWAHAQVTGQLTAQAPLKQVEAQSPQRTSSRLICPRKLTPSTAYHACVVPAFQTGVLAGLGLPLSAEDQTSLQPAWKPNALSILLPIYFRWEFSTGPAGDFAALIKLITSYSFPAGSGIRDMRVSAAGQRLPAAVAGSPDAVVGLESALVAPKTRPRVWSNNYATQFRNALRGLLEVATDSAADPLVTPPLYAGKHVNQIRPPADTAPPHWLRELNLHPGYRAIAGMGTRVVQQQQEALMASAWEQVGEVEKANNLLRQGQLVRAAAIAIHQRSLAKLAPGALLQVTRPVHARVAVAAQTTLQKVLTSNNMPLAIVTPEFRKVARPRGPLLRSVLPPGQRTLRPVVAKIAATTATIAFERPVVPTITPEMVEARFKAAGGTRPAGAPAVVFIHLQGLPMAGVPPRPSFTIRPPELPGTTPPLIAVFPGPPNVDSPQASRYRAAIQAHQGLLGPASIVFGPILPTLKMETVAPMVMAQLHPDVAISGWIRSLTRIGGQPAVGADLEPVAAAPEFPQPMYAALRELSPDLVAPGLDQIPDNKVALLEANPRFVEAFLAGLNHEMARELLWRGYPTDQRGTYFRSFWDSRGRPTPAGAASASGDIPSMHTWPEARHLGEIASASSNAMVLLIKAELLRRYPNASVYAVAGVIPAGQTKPRLGTQEIHPVFRGTLDPDISFFGFPITAAQAVGKSPNPPAGLFFVIQEHPCEPRFGLSANAPPETPLAPGPDSASTARALLQRPVRLAIHAADLLKGIEI